MDTSKKQIRKTNPIARANPLSLITFGYTFGLFKKGFTSDLEENDLYGVVESCKSKKLADITEKQWTKQPSVVKLLFHHFGIQYLIISVINCIWAEIESILTPLGQSRLIAYFTPHQTEITKNQAYRYAGIVLCLKVGAFLVLNNLRVFQTIVGMKIHASLKSLLYRKALKLSPHSSSETNLGNLLTLITKDVGYVEANIWLIKELTILLLQFFTVAYLMYNKMGPPAFIGLGLLFVSVPFQAFLSVQLKNWRMQVQRSSDERIQRTQETLSAIKIIKMYTWEKFFYSRVSQSRKKEMKNMIYVYFANIVNLTIGLLVSKAAFCIFIIVYVALGYTTTTEMVYYVLNLFNQLNNQFGVSLPMNFSKAAQLYASLVRLNKVLKVEELCRIDEHVAGKPSIILEDASFSLGEKNILRGVSMKVTTTGLTVVTGLVGSGKSSLLKVILKDYYPISEGNVEVRGIISYASQDPWLFPATIRQNILFGEEFNQTRYDEVVRVCALQYDFSLLDHGDLTVIADKGMNLSGGQQARVNLARAVYRRGDIYLLDDPLSALDSHIQDYIFKECLMKFLEDKMCILVSQNSLHIKKADNVIVLNEGKTLFAGDTENVDKDIITELTMKLREEQEMKEKYVPDHADEKNSLIETEQQEVKKNVYKEVKQTGKVSLNIYQKYFQYGGGFIIFAFIITVYIGAQYFESFGHRLLTKWVDLQQKVIDMKNNSTINGSDYDEVVTEKNNAFSMYGIFTGIGITGTLTAFYSLMRFCQRASVTLHKAMLNGLTGATMHFYDNHYIGNILNRFSYDLNNIDESIPFLYPSLAATAFGAAGTLVLITSVNRFFLLPSLSFIVILILLRYFLMPTIRSLKRLEASTRSPLVGHINSSLEGLTTVRAFRAEQILKDEFDKQQDLYTSASMMLRISMVSVGYYMDFFNSMFTFIVIARLIFFDINTTAGNVGLALTQVFLLTHLSQISITMWTLLENAMTSFERAVEYTTLKQEKTAGRVVENWPSQGAIQFQKVNLCYEGCKTSVLEEITFDVNSQEKIGIVGRTGAGKSSIITVLFRLYDFEGNIEIDGIDTKTISLELLRKSISIIPQDPVLFTGTFRENIDPFNKYSDDAIWDVINKVAITHMIPTLDTFIEESGAKYSSGEKQMVCLARAALRECKILLLDEATANMDIETEKLLNEVIEEIFSDCTILAIAHRLQSILNCDRVLVLDNGKIIEFDSPSVLMNKKDGLFAKMCQESKIE